MAVYKRDPSTGVETTVAGIQDLSVYESRISDIEDVIPSDATSSNQLVTKGDLGTAAAKDYTDTVRPNSHDLVESNAVYNAINNAMSTIYTPRGSISCAELSPNLLVDANIGNVYNTSDSGTTTQYFMQGAGVTINQGDSVSIIKAGQSVILFNLMGNTLDLTDYQKKDLAQAVESATTVEGALGALSTNKATQAEVNGIVNVLGAKNLLPNKATTQTIGGVTYTINSDGTINMSGANTSGSWINLNICDSDTLKAILSKHKGQKMIFSMTQDYDYDTRNVCIHYNIGGTDTYIVPNPKEIEFTVPNNIDTATSITVPVGVSVGKTASTTNLGLMLRLASDPDNTYVPYAMTNQQITPYIQAISNPNLLDNPWFTINQRGATSCSSGYGVDRWMPQRADITVNADKTLTVTPTELSTSNGYIGQRIEKENSLLGKTVTISALLSDGTITSHTFDTIKDAVNNAVEGNYNFGYSTTTSSSYDLVWFGLRSKSTISSVTIKAIKLELGSVSTLAMDTAPNYQQELEKCRRYFVRYIPSVNSATPIGRGFAVNATTMWIDITLPTSMRAMPSLTCSDISSFGYSERDSSAFVEFISMAVGAMVVNHINITGVDNAHTMTIGNTYIIYAKNGAYIDFSADL